MTDFNKDNQTGKIGEAAVKAALEALGHTVVDVSDNEDYQQYDIDLLLSRNGQTTTLEVKNDVKSNKAGNVYVETWCEENSYSRCGQGWYYYCEAAYIAFVQMKKQKAHIITYSDLVNLIDTHTYRKTEKWDGSAEGYLVPLSHIEQCKSYYLLKLKGEAAYEF